MSDLICYQFSRDLVEIGDAKNFHARFGKQRLPVGKQLGAIFERTKAVFEYFNLPFDAGPPPR
jgi:hypothetical protein